jgi:hypothetical protein
MQQQLPVFPGFLISSPDVDTSILNSSALSVLINVADPYSASED